MITGRRASLFCAALVFTIALSMGGAVRGGGKKYRKGGGTSRVTPPIAYPISPATGAFFESRRLLDLGGPMGLGYTLHYKPELWTHFPAYMTHKPDGANDGAFASSLDMELIDITEDSSGDRSVHVVLGDVEEVLRYDAPSGTFQATGGVPFVLKIVNDYYYLLHPREKRVYIFQKVNKSFDNVEGHHSNWWGMVKTIFDRNGNSLRFTHDGIALSQVTDGLGRTINFTMDYNTDWPYPNKQVDDGKGRVIGFTKGSCTFATLKDARGKTTAFQTATGSRCRLITKIVRPLGNSHVDQTWKATPRALNPYQYAAGDPVGRMDVTGLAEILNDLWAYNDDNGEWEELVPVNQNDIEAWWSMVTSEMYSHDAWVKKIGASLLKCCQPST